MRTLRPIVAVLALLVGASFSWSVRARPAPRAHDRGDSEAADTLATRAAAARRVVWRRPGFAARASADNPTVRVKILGINDFHGQLSAGRLLGGRPVGGAAVLASYLEAAAHDPNDPGLADRTFIVHAGDLVGASPPASALLQDEPSISFLNMLANRFCRCARRCDSSDPKDTRRDPRCNVVGTPGNHEFDEGRAELMRLVDGGNHPTGPFLERPYRGARFPYISANVVSKRTGRPILPPFVIKKANGVRIAFIGAVLKATPAMVTPSGVAGLAFLDEADAINRYVAELRRREHIRAFVVLIHQGGTQPPYTGPTQPDRAINAGSAILDVVSRLDDDVDVVVSGHTHLFSNALVRNRHGVDVLVAQAFSAGTAYDDIELRVDRKTGDVVEKSASIVTTFADAGPGVTPDPEVAALVARAEAAVAPLVKRVVGTAAGPITRAENAAGESALGDLIADAQRAAMGTDFAFINSGGIRADITAAGPVTWGTLFAIQPFGNGLVRMTLTGQQIYDVLNQQWAGGNPGSPMMLKTSGLTYTWDATRPPASRVVEVRKNGVAIDRAATYSVTVNEFLAEGGDNFTVFTRGRSRAGGPVDLDALVVYIKRLTQPFGAAVEGRITRLN
jgi:5'-nucleotidase